MLQIIFGANIILQSDSKRVFLGEIYDNDLAFMKETVTLKV
jgi:hypothetical protein